MDDDELIVEAITESVALTGCSYDAFSDPVKCLQYLKNHRNSYDFAFIDLAMPMINGVEFLNLASHFFVNSPQKFIMTGLAELSGKEVVDTSNFQVLQKPLSIRELKKKMGLDFLD
ncbi:response regulator [Tateyamaria sp. Alg231-49]|uniref:response regulator n=1 Tax=Tateyamaria sp. Alg231-49 TaxID=1922219 RepID=UPI00131EFF71|nr:response regulator [Tateyamaria sp. Alg231-49]